jgi:hypothetical protein
LIPSLQKKRSKDEDKTTKEPELNLYKDYTKVKPLASSSEEESKVSQNSLPDSSEDEEVFRKEQVKKISGEIERCAAFVWYLP